MAFNSENTVPLWDFSSPDLPRINDDDFLTLLQKQFGLNMPAAPNANDATTVRVTDGTGVDPQNLLNFPHVQESPPSDDTSPSPPAGSSRRQSGIFDGDEGLKRKMSDDDDLEEGPSHKSQHTSASRKGSTSRRKSSGGGGGQDETRLLKRKEQNRAAQRAFRERKEKHVKDLEDKVAALEAKNEEAGHENENLRELLSRLQQENVALKEAQFTFSVAKPHNHPSSSRSSSHDSPNGLFSMHSPNGSRDSPMFYAEKVPSTNIGGIDWGNLPVYDATTLNLIESDPQFAAQIGFSPSFTGGAGPMMGIQNTNTMTSNTPYMTIASNPLYMSFADPPASSSTNSNNAHTPSGSTPSSNNNATSFDSFASNTFSPWPDTSTQSLSSMDFSGPMSLDDIFGSQFLQPQPDLQFSFGNKASPGQSSTSSLSPVVHQKSPSTVGTSPAESSGSSVHDENNQKCPRTKDELAKAVSAQGMSLFTNAPGANASANGPPGEVTALAPNSSISRKPAASVACKTDGNFLPKTEMNPRNIEVLDAWREVTADPAFKEHDLADLCALFTSQARCDGTKVVLEPSGMESIKKSLSSRETGKSTPPTEYTI